MNQNGPTCQQSTVRNNGFCLLPTETRKHHPKETIMNAKEQALFEQLTKQFGKHDASHFMLAPHKYSHRFDENALAAFNTASDKHGHICVQAP